MLFWISLHVLLPVNIQIPLLLDLSVCFVLPVSFFLCKMFDNSFVCLFDHLGHIIIDDDDYAKFFVAVFRSSSWWSIFICIVFDVASVAIAINSINRSRFVQMKLFFPLKFLICSLKNHYIIHSFRKFQKAAASVQTNPIKYHHL